jgi:hypothetical protein
LVKRILRAEKKAATDSRGLYVYCVIPYLNEKESFGNLGFDAEEVYTLEYRDLAPVVSDVTYRDYAVDEQEVEVHRNVVEQVMQVHSVIPVAYGMAFKSRKLLQIAMSAGYQAMHKALPVVEGKVELGIKVFLPKDIEPMGPTEREVCSSDFLHSLLAVSADNKKLKLFSDRLILNSTFLVEKSRMDEFSKQVGLLTEKYNNLLVQYSGPWPAYNFVDIHILGGKRRGFR